MTETSYWIVPTDATFDERSEEFFKDLLLKRRIFGFRKEKKIQLGDRICFYAIKRGIVSDASAATGVSYEPDRISPLYSFVFELDKVRFYFENPIVLDFQLRKKLDAYNGKDPSGTWSWFVQTAHRISHHDFDFLTLPT